MYIGLVFEKVKVLPGALTCVMNRLSFGAATRAGKAAATGEGNIEVNALGIGVEANVTDPPHGALKPSAAVKRVCSLAMMPPRFAGVGRHNI